MWSPATKCNQLIYIFIYGVCYLVITSGPAPATGAQALPCPARCRHKAAVRIPVQSPPGHGAAARLTARTGAAGGCANPLPATAEACAGAANTPDATTGVAWLKAGFARALAAIAQAVQTTKRWRPANQGQSVSSLSLPASLAAGFAGFVPDSPAHKFASHS